MDTGKRQAWSTYWSSGALHSCTSSFHGNYSGILADFWMEVFQERPARRMLDLATGNGAVPKLALECIRTRPLEIVGVDLADILPDWINDGQKDILHMHSGVHLETLPFSDGEFDLITSQYGIEYAEWPQAVNEAVRVCEAGGRLACVIHHENSVVVRVGEQENTNLSLLLADDGVLDAASKVLPWLGDARHATVPASNFPEKVQARLGYNTAMDKIAEVLVDNFVPDILLQFRHEVHALLSRVSRAEIGVDTAFNRLRQWRDALEASKSRTTSMIESARNADSILEFGHIVMRRYPGARLDITELQQDEGVLGWGVKALLQ